MTMAAVDLPGWELENEPPRATIHVAQFKAYYISLVPARQGDYKLSLGVVHENKDEAWKLSDFDGNMLEIAVSTLRRIQ